MEHIIFLLILDSEIIGMLTEEEGMPLYCTGIVMIMAATTTGDIFGWFRDNQFKQKRQPPLRGFLDPSKICAVLQGGTDDPWCCGARIKKENTRRSVIVFCV
jgi:hypothetical protein